jgi:hypothetical protein
MFLDPAACIWSRRTPVRRRHSAQSRIDFPRADPIAGPLHRSSWLVKKHIHVPIHLAAPKTRSSARAIDQALACSIDADTSMCRTQAGEKRSL